MTHKDINFTCQVKHDQTCFIQVCLKQAVTFQKFSSALKIVLSFLWNFLALNGSSTVIMACSHFIFSPGLVNTITPLCQPWSFLCLSRFTKSPSSQFSQQLLLTVQFLYHSFFAVQLLIMYPTLCDPMDYSPPGSSVHGILQARILEWVVISFSNTTSWNQENRIRYKLTTETIFINENPRSIGNYGCY